MGLFNSIAADLLCPITGTISTHTRIQIKWQMQRALGLQTYHLGDLLEDLDPKYDDTYVRTEYICNACSPKTTGWNGREYIRTEDQRWHIVFVEIAATRVRRILTGAEFAELGVDEFVDDAWIAQENGKRDGGDGET